MVIRADGSWHVLLSSSRGRPDIRSGRFTTSDILEVIYARANVWISDVVLGEQERVLRACITSFRSDETDINCLIKELDYARNVRLGRMDK